MMKMNEFSIFDISDEKELRFSEDNDFLPFVVAFYIEEQEQISDVNILKKYLPNDILENIVDDEYFRIPKKYKSKLKFIEFMESIDFVYDSCNF